jgi:phosphatidylserine/phosphatidylglycerophosphate/cardiolipin synthase-like enzyme
MKRFFFFLDRNLSKIPACVIAAIVTSVLVYPGVVQAVVSASPRTKFEVGFSPNGSSLEIILEGIQQAKKSILVAAYSFTSKPVSSALVDAHKRGVKVQVIADKKSNTGQYSAVAFLADQGVAVRLNGNYQIFHHKFMVFDGRHVETGSFNYSAAAVNKNAENVLMILNNKPVAAMYVQQWQSLWNESVDVHK